MSDQVDAAPKETNKKSGKTGGGVQSLHGALAILQAVADQREGVGLVKLSDAVELHRSTTFHLAKTMVSLGLLRQKAGDKRYRVGTRLFSLASGSLDEIDSWWFSAPVTSFKRLSSTRPW